VIVAGRKALASPLVLVRHGRAEDEHPAGDGARGLTAEGRREMLAHARTLAPRLRLDGIATSPLVRAVQTAEILAEALDLREVAVRADLGASEAPDGVLAAARDLGPGWALVGHNPALGMALARLLGSSSPALRFRKGAAAALEPAGSGGPWRLLWVAAPGRKLKHSAD
jgi:phosphohistidine phosphatase